MVSAEPSYTEGNLHADPHLKCRINAARTPEIVAMCSREQASSLCSRDLGECRGGVPGGVGVAVALSLPAAQCRSMSEA